ncbi:MAG: MFS transporter [Candidatus Latescibacterota bacterium]|nr:MFS transporter [Candidatus Latescibacterota bacterium]
MSTSPLRRSRLVDASPVFYGWIILFVSALGSIMTSPGQTYAVSVFIDSFMVDLGLSRSTISTLYTAGTLTASFALPWVGRQFDLRGARLTMTVISLLLGLSCLYMSFVRDAVMLGIGFCALRLLGQGSLSLVSKNTVNQWWVRRRGMAMGIVGLSGALLGSSGFPNLINSLIPPFGWRVTYQLLGALLLLVMVPLSWILVRDRPEDYGQQPDGYTPRLYDTLTASASGQEAIWTLREALRTPVFWIVSAGLAAMSMLNTGLTFHIFSIFKDSGLSATLAASVFVPIGVAGALVQLASGVLVDRMPLRFMLALTLCLEAVILFMAPVLTSANMAMVLGVLMGVQGGIELLVASVVWAKFYGRAHMGAISGLASTICVGASALGPMPFGIARDLLGSYVAMLQGFSVLPLCLALICLVFCRPPCYEKGNA